jgi:hypothetical protein
MLLVGVIAFLYILIIAMHRKVKELEMRLEWVAGAFLVHLLKSGEFDDDAELKAIVALNEFQNKHEDDLKTERKI